MLVTAFGVPLTMMRSGIDSVAEAFESSLLPGLTGLEDEVSEFIASRGANWSRMYSI